MSTIVLQNTPLNSISEVVERQSAAVLTRPLMPIEERVKQLEMLEYAVKTHSQAIAQALYEDLGKSSLEASIAEIQFVLGEIKHTLKHLKKWMKPKRVSTPWVLMPARSYIVSEPLGRVLIIAPWNYPFQLLLSPLVGALAAGNQVVLKPSELAPATATIITRLVRENFDPRILAVVNGGVEETGHLLDQRFDHIFYTGNGHVGRIVMQKAARHLTPVTLELGGKSPCVIAGAPDMETTARRIAWGKWFNAGQTCVAPDYILVESRLKDQFLKALAGAIKEFYGDNVEESPDYGRIINARHFARLSELFDASDVLIGGETNKDKNFIAPTVISATFSHRIMADEIFGPILPVIEVTSIEEAINIINRNDHPLAAYIFTSDSSYEERFTKQVHAGGMCLNDCLMHLSNPNLPFGGVGPSGMGAYHGHESFKIFSHQKSVLKRFFPFDLKLRYPPYSGKLRPLLWLMRWFG